LVASARKSPAFIDAAAFIQYNKQKAVEDYKLNMIKKRNLRFPVLALLLAVFFALGSPLAAHAESSLPLTPEERAFIAEHKVLKAAAMGGVAPIVYRGADGEVQGIARLIFDEISVMTGLNFEYVLYPSVKDSLDSDYDLFFVSERRYAPDELLLSVPYLQSETILFFNAALNSDKLDDKIYAAVRGSALPEGIREENAVYYNTREDTLDAVNSGKADYGYGNSYSVTFYTLNNSYKNIVTVPIEKESRQYCAGVDAGNEVLLSIINKAIDAISESRMLNLTLNAMIADRKISFAMLINAYGEQIFIAVVVIIGLLLLGIASYIRVNRKLRLQNLRHERLAELSNEYLYEYFPSTGQLKLSEKCALLFEAAGALQAPPNALKELLTQVDHGGQPTTITLPLSSGAPGVFKAVNLCVCDGSGKLDSVIGKLIDVSAEAAEKDRLILESQTDGLTGLYNAAAIRELISESLAQRDGQKTDALLLMDLDNFKRVNDSYGHLTGDQVLEQFGRCLRQTFGGVDLIGRVGGDEFVVYARDVPSADFVRERFHRLVRHMQTACTIPITISGGIVLVQAETYYESVFQLADEALYRAKRNGKNQVVIHGEPLE
jgi:diguanylate cyclase (GGDEF)-like protein